MYAMDDSLSPLEANVGNDAWKQTNSLNVVKMKFCPAAANS